MVQPVLLRRAAQLTRLRRRRSGVAVLGTLFTLALMRLLSARSCGASGGGGPGARAAIIKVMAKATGKWVTRALAGHAGEASGPHPCSPSSSP